MDRALRRGDRLTRIAMVWLRRHRVPFSLVRLAWLAALLGLLACPLEYRGGAEFPHAHAIFQLFYDAAHGSIDHHHDDGDPATDDADNPPPAPHDPVLTPAGARVSPMGESVDGLVVALAAAAIWLVGRQGRWPEPPADRFGDGERPAPEPPPPRLRFAV